MLFTSAIAFADVEVVEGRSASSLWISDTTALTEVPDLTTWACLVGVGWAGAGAIFLIQNLVGSAFWWVDAFAVA